MSDVALKMVGSTSDKDRVLKKRSIFLSTTQKKYFAKNIKYTKLVRFICYIGKGILEKKCTNEYTLRQVDMGMGYLSVKFVQ